MTSSRACRLPDARRLALLAALLACASPLAACGRHDAAPAEALPPPPATSEPLAGAPDGPPVPPPPSAPTDSAPPLDAPSAAPSPSGIVAMAPIPNPPEPAPRARVSVRRRHRAPALLEVRRPSRVRRVRHRRIRAPHAAAQHHAAVRTHPASATRPVAAHRPRPAPARAAAASSVSTDAGPRADRIASLQTALGGEVARTAKLEVPAFEAGKAAAVTLTVPAGFADTLRTEAGRLALSDEAASANLTARLAGDGYTVLPGDAQAQPLQAGQPTRFQWTVTAEPHARGPLQAQVGASLLGGGSDLLDLGAVNAPPSGAGMGWRAVGGGLLALLAVLAVALFARYRERRAAVPAEVRRPRPFDMNGGPRA